MSGVGRFLVACLLVAATVAGLAVATGDAGGAHGAETNYTAVPHEAPGDREPGNQDASYRQFAVSPRDIDYLDYIASTWHEGGFAGCGPTNSEVFGIDRGNDDPSTAIDEDLEPYIEETTVNEDYFEANFYERDDAIGSSTHLAEGDQFVGFVTDCFDNPAEPGWYQIRSSVGGWMDDGTYIQRNTTSHYFWICDCANEREARERLGPPPSEATPTPTSTATVAQTPTPTAAAGETPASSPTPTASPTVTPAPVETAVGDPGDDSDDDAGTSPDDGEAATATPTPTPEDWEEFVRRTPTAGEAPGVGPAGALLAVLAGALLALGRRG